MINITLYAVSIVSSFFFVEPGIGCPRSSALSGNILRKVRRGSVLPSAPVSTFAFNVWVPGLSGSLICSSERISVRLSLCCWTATVIYMINITAHKLNDTRQNIRNLWDIYAYWLKYPETPNHSCILARISGDSGAFMHTGSNIRRLWGIHAYWLKYPEILYHSFILAQISRDSVPLMRMDSNLLWHSGIKMFWFKYPVIL